MAFAHKALCSLLAAASLSACGGGGSSPDVAAVHAQTQQQVGQALTNITAPLPEPKKFEGGFVSINGVAQGYLAGTSPRNLADQIAKEVVSEPVKWASLYRDMLSANGLVISVAGEKIGNSAVNNAPIYAPTSVFVAKLTANGIVITGG